MPTSTQDTSEIEIVQEGGLGPILDGAASPDRELQSQCARALRNLSVNREHVYSTNVGSTCPGNYNHVV